jgi:hypothetical protein
MAVSSMTQVAHERSKRTSGAPAHERFKVQRESGSDWCVIDTRSSIPVVTGLDFDEAQKTAEARNKRRWRKSSF